MKRFYRSIRDKKILGICSGIGNITNTDPLIWRLLFVGLVFTPFPIGILYLITGLLTESIEYTE